MDSRISAMPFDARVTSIPEYAVLYKKTPEGKFDLGGFGGLVDRIKETTNGFDITVRKAEMLKEFQQADKDVDKILDLTGNRMGKINVNDSEKRDADLKTFRDGNFGNHGGQTGRIVGNLDNYAIDGETLVEMGKEAQKMIRQLDSAHSIGLNEDNKAHLVRNALKIQFMMHKRLAPKYGEMSRILGDRRADIPNQALFVLDLVAQGNVPDSSFSPFEEKLGESPRLQQLTADVLADGWVAGQMKESVINNLWGGIISDGGLYRVAYDHMPVLVMKGYDVSQMAIDRLNQNYNPSYPASGWERFKTDSIQRLKRNLPDKLKALDAIAAEGIPEEFRAKESSAGLAPEVRYLSDVRRAKASLDAALDRNDQEIGALRHLLELREQLRAQGASAQAGLNDQIAPLEEIDLKNAGRRKNADERKKFGTTDMEIHASLDALSLDATKITSTEALQRLYDLWDQIPVMYGVDANEMAEKLVDAHVMATNSLRTLTRPGMNVKAFEMLKPAIDGLIIAPLAEFIGGEKLALGRQQLEKLRTAEPVIEVTNRDVIEKTLADAARITSFIDKVPKSPSTHNT